MDVEWKHLKAGGNAGLFVWSDAVTAPGVPFTRSIAPMYNGARRWIRLGPVQLQVSELARLAVIIWCAMLATGRQYLLGSWFLAASPGLAILVVSLAFNLFGDGLRDVLDPRDE